jgi:CRP-like cAMP-binding protein
MVEPPVAPCGFRTLYALLQCPDHFPEITMNTTAPAINEAVKASRLAEGLSPEQVAVLAPLLTLQPVEKQQVLAREGSADNRLYAIVQGSLVIVKHIGTPEEATLLTLDAGDFAHELGFLDGAPRYASLVAAGPGQVLVLEREKLESLIDTHPRILYSVMCAIVRTVHRVQTRMAMQASELTNYIVKQHGRY